MTDQNAAKIQGRDDNRVLLGCVLAVMGFLAIQIWYMSDRLARVETNVSTILREQGNGK